MNAPLVTAPNSGIPFASRRKDDIKRLLGDKLSTDMSPEEWDGLIAGLLKFLSEEAGEPEHAGADIAMDRALYAWDESVRTEDIDGRMRVATMNISKACVNPYKGDEIPGCEELGLDPNRVYYLLRHPDELKKAAASSNGVQILRKHIPVSADDHQPWDVVGALGTDGRFEAPYLKNSGTFWVADDIAGIKSGAKKQLSLGYHYRPEMTAGKFGDIPYDGTMRDIVVNHVALVEDGRAGPDVVVGDSAEKITMPTRLAAFALMSTAAAIAPLLAMDKKVDLMPIFKDLNSKNYKPKDVFAALQKTLKGKLAADVSMKHVADLLEHVPSEESMDESVSEAQHNAMEAAAHGHSNLGIPKKVGEEFAKADEGKDNFMGDNIYKKAMDFFAKHGDDAMTEAFKAHMGEPGGHDEENEEAEEENEGLKAPPDLEPAKDRRAAKDKRRGHDGAPMISKQAMDQAIAAANAATAKTVTERIRKEQRDLRSAEEFAVKKVGKLDALTFDTAEQLNRHVLKMLGCDGADTIHASALHHVIAAYPDAGAKPVEHRREQRLGADAAAKKTALEFAPGLANIRIGV